MRGPVGGDIASGCEKTVFHKSPPTTFIESGRVKFYARAMHASLTFIGCVCVCWLLAVQLLLTLLSSVRLAPLGHSLALWLLQLSEMESECDTQLTWCAPAIKSLMPFNRPPATFCPLGVTSREKSLAKAIPQQT
jgi:hypothetical protein